MSRSILLLVLVIFLVQQTLCYVAEQQQKRVLTPSTTTATHPHILFLLLDDLGHTDCGYSGAEYPTPNIDALAAQSVRLNQYYTDPTCTPSRSSFMTGRFSFRLGLQSIYTNQPSTNQHIPYDTPTVAELLKKEGYSTNMIGKWHLGYASWNQTPTGRGFDHYYGYMQGGEYYYNHTLPTTIFPPYEGYGYDFWDDRNVLNVIGNFSSDLFTNEALRIIQNHDPSTPFFLYFSAQTVHAPIEVPPYNSDDVKTCSSIQDEVRRNYCLNMLYIDRGIGQIITLLKSKGMYDNLFGLFSTDNGGMVHVGGQFDMSDFLASSASNYPFRGGKVTNFEGGVRGLGFLFGGYVPESLQGTISQGLFHAVDYPATILAVAGAAFPEKFDGMSMMDVINNVTASRELLPIHIEAYGLNFTSIRYNQYKLIVGTPMYDGYFIPGQEVIQPNQTCQGYCLFDVVQDPYETTDLSSTHRQLVLQMFAKIESFVLSGDYMKEQTPTIDPNGAPDKNNGNWAPWIN